MIRWPLLEGRRREDEEGGELEGNEVAFGTHPAGFTITIQRLDKNEGRKQKRKKTHSTGEIKTKKTQQRRGSGESTAMTCMESTAGREEKNEKENKKARLESLGAKMRRKTTYLDEEKGHQRCVEK